MKSKLTAIVVAIFGACAICCLLPFASILGLSAALAYLRVEKIEFLTILLVSVAILASMYLFKKIHNGNGQSMCSTNCGCKSQEG